MFQKGMAAKEVIVEIIRQNPHINRVSLISLAWENWAASENGIGSCHLYRDDVFGGELDIIIQKNEEKNQAVTISSLTKAYSEAKKSQEYHIPMLDFSVKKSPCNKRLMIDALRRSIESKTIPEGVLLETDKSYHYYGRTLLNTNEWAQFMAYALLMQPKGRHLIDCRWIGWRLRAGFGMLRLNRKHKNGTVPSVIAVISKSASVSAPVSKKPRIIDYSESHYR